mgnify:CR=1 FL=1
MELFTLLVIWGLLSWGVAALATSRGRSGFGYFLLSFFLSPLLGLIVVLVTKDLAAEATRDAERRREEEGRELDRKREHEKQLESLRALAVKASPGADASVPSRVSVADELQKLATLRDNGVLTPDEFDQQKRALLSRVSGAV